MQGDLKAAEADYCEALHWQPDDPKFHSDLGQVYLELDKVEEAEKQFQKALEYDYKNLRALKGLGSLRQEQGDSARAMYLYLRYLEIEPKDSMILHNLGAIFHNMGNYDQALEYYARALKEDPDDLLILKNQAITLIAARRPTEAKEILLRAAKLDSEDDSIDRMLASIFEDENNDEKAFEYYRSAIKKDPDDPETHLQLTFLYSTHQDFRESAKHAEQAGKLFDKNGDSEGAAQAYWQLGWDYYLLKEFEKSLAASTQSLRFNPNQGAVYFNLGLVLLHVGREAEARKRYEDGIQNLTQISDLKYYAIDDLRDALEKNPNLKGGQEILSMLEKRYAATSEQISAESSTPSTTPNFEELISTRGPSSPRNE
jgi:tetratricopeptide (TPR) repeat protein